MKFFIYSNDKGYDVGRNFYTGKTYIVNHERYAVVGSVGDVKIYSREYLAYKACDSLNQRTASFWDVGIMLDDGTITDMKPRTNDVLLSEKESKDEKCYITKNSHDEISAKEKLKILIEYAFRSGMNYGYGIDHENIDVSENEAWNEFSKTVKEIN